MIGPKNISLSAKGTLAPLEITSNPEAIIWSTCSLVTNLEAAHGAKTCAPNDQIFSIDFFKRNHIISY